MSNADSIFVRKVEISVLVYATEDEKKVERAVLKIIPREVLGTNPKISKLKGHYSDDIVLINMRIKKREEAGLILLRLVNSLSQLDRQRLFKEASERMDKAGNIFLRLDKQNAYYGRVILSNADPIHMKFSFHLPRGADPVKLFRKYIAEFIDQGEFVSEIK